MQPATLWIDARGTPLDDGGVALHMALKSRVQPKADVPAQERVHFTGTVHVARQARHTPAVSFAKPGPRQLTVGGKAIYGLYFHGPAYKVLEGVRLDRGRAVGLMAADLPPEASPARAASIVSPRLVELCFQTAGILEVTERESLGLPTALRKLTVFRRPDPAAGGRLYAEVWVNGSPDEYDARVVDEQGEVYVELQGYRTIALPGKRSLA
jgi:hypothetical protein